MTSRKNFHVGVLVFPGCLRSSAVTPLDAFEVATTLSHHRSADRHMGIQGHWVNARNLRSMTVQGLGFATEPIGERALDALLVPGIHHRGADDLSQALGKLAPERQAVQDFAAGGRLLLSNCSGACLLAEAGLLDGRRATTSWWLASYFRKRFPQVRLDADALVVADGACVTSGGVTAYLDLALWLVERFGGADLRQMTAKALVTDAHRTSQLPYVAEAIMQDEGHAVVERARSWLNRHLDRAWTINELAEHCHVSTRTLSRRFQEAQGMSPVKYAQQLRIERAKALLESTRLSLENIAGRCGYEDVSTFSKVFKRWVQATPRGYRERFGLRR